MPLQLKAMAEPLPTGTVTFLFTDIEGSTALAQRFPDEMPALLAQHHALLQATIERQHGHVFRISSDAFCAAFSTAAGAGDEGGLGRAAGRAQPRRPYVEGALALARAAG
jgi:class 3 adenylate cyclase